MKDSTKPKPLIVEVQSKAVQQAPKLLPPRRMFPPTLAAKKATKSVKKPPKDFLIAELVPGANKRMAYIKLPNSVLRTDRAMKHPMTLKPVRTQKNTQQ